ncbi:fumarylacetoacetate hydrolase family protein [Thalassotalea agarivorans]|uniref:2-keto-4-pentenoate hydratase/2-oxohepta-3-ene-1,7-dioic acid hydratase (Catechol pathway) n=1 Tax=Thalassotalea agarivorans TaxID=349064 RepID=A0A1I0BLT9_THASX|nr:fumarylacetoacetate hydrolase family protein [Thalassotalea agarivorans]SET07560.1 2-keto-4-pentenoate hydratase/2-oxohepta-3-ene-1,7-dioic acid hydratase (catechol pathway) [Thalassotalea agarivorans]
MNQVNVEKQLKSPAKVVCIGRNYVAHIEELGNEVPDQMVVFMKPNSAISSVLQSFHQETLHYEGEICLMIEHGKFGYVGFGLDLTKRGLQSKLKQKGLPWERAKAFDGAAVLSDFVAIDSVEGLRLELWIDGELIQSGGIELMMYKPDDIIEELGSFTSLTDGDVVMTGTPAGVGEVAKGAVFEGKIFQHDTLLVSHLWTAE